MEREAQAVKPHCACLGEPGPEVLQRQLPPPHPANLRPAPSSLQEGGREQVKPEILAAHWDAPLGKSHPLPPLLGHVGGTVSDLLSGHRLSPENVGEIEGQGKEKKGEGREYMGRGLPPQILKSPKEEVPWSLALALPLPPGSTQLSIAPPPRQPQSCEKDGLRGREEERAPQAAHSQLWQEGRAGRVREKAEAGGRLEAAAGQWKGGALGTKAHLRICSASAGPLVLALRGTAAGPGSVRGDTDGGRLSTRGATGGLQDPEGLPVMCTHRLLLLSWGFSPSGHGPGPHQHQVSALGPRLAESE